MRDTKQSKNFIISKILEPCNDEKMISMNKWILGLLMLVLLSCGQQERKKANTPAYFDINGYFEKEIERLKKDNPTVQKEVLAKGKTEQKNLKITDWKIELSSFSEADINKAAWRNEFTPKQTSNRTTYSTTNSKIPIKFVEIIKTGNKITGIKIFKNTQNTLYTSTDTLFYYPDSLYVIKSFQKIKLLTSKTYRIVGKLTKN